MIEWRKVAEGAGGLRIYRVDAESGNFSGSSGRIPSPLQAALERFATPTTRYLLENFGESAAPVGASSFSVACHVVSLPDLLFVVDSTYRTTAGRVFPGVLEEMVRAEGRRLQERPIRVLYTHAHFDHAGGHAAVEALGSDVEILAHPFTEELFPVVSRRESFLRTRAGFFRDCGITLDLDAMTEEIRGLYLRRMQEAGVDFDRAPWGSVEEGPLRVDRHVEPDGALLSLADARLELLRFDGHIPGHLCVRVDGRHLITGDMWLPATTSLVTPGTLAALAGVPSERCGLLRYLESSLRLLDLDVDECTSYPSHEVVFHNPKRMAMRDLEIFAERVSMVYAVLREHEREPMRVLDVAWGGRAHLPIWKVEGSTFRLVIAHDEAAAWVQDLAALGDLREVEPERYVWTGGWELASRIRDALALARERYAHLEFRSRGSSAPETAEDGKPGEPQRGSGSREGLQ